MNIKPNILVHIAIWLALFLSPLSFLHRNEPFNYSHYIMMCMGLFSLMVVFYMNYLWLTSRYYMHHDLRTFFFINLIMIFTLGVFVHYWHNFVDSSFANESRLHHDPTPLRTILFIIRHMFNLCASAAIATTIKLASGWRRSEEARQEAEAARTDAELRNLRSQINPHFLLNTLNNIYSLATIDTKRTQDAIQQLSKLLHHLLYDNQEAEVALEDELQFLDNYVTLMCIRLPQDVELTFDRPHNKTNIRIAPLIFISLVENAFKHGISPTRSSFIHIKVSVEGAQVIFFIENSNHSKTGTDRSGNGIGLQLVQHRLTLSYPGRHEWTYGFSSDRDTYQSLIRLDTSF